MDYRKVAEEIYEKVGKKENLVSAAHCATRLRLVLVDNAQCDAKAVEEIDGVKGVFSASGQLQIILGTGTVNKVYDEFLAISGLSAASKEDAKAAAAAKQPIYKRAIKTLGDIFVPIIPAIVASGFLMGIMEALNFMVNNGFLNIDTSGSIFVFANLFANTAYVFLPILIAYSAAYGVSAEEGAIALTLLRAPKIPDMEADMGEHRFTYAFTFWNGSFLACDVVREAYELNVPVPVTPGSGSRSFLELSNPDIILDTVKRAEDGSGDLVLRLYESKRTTAACDILLRDGYGQAEETNLIEEPAAPLPVEQNRIRLRFRPFEIKTIRLKKGPA